MFSRNSTICGLNKGCGLFDPHPLISPSNPPPCPPATTLGTFLLEAKRMLISPPAFSLSLKIPDLLSQLPFGTEWNS